MLTPSLKAASSINMPMAHVTRAGLDCLERCNHVEKSLREKKIDSAETREFRSSSGCTNLNLKEIEWKSCM